MVSAIDRARRALVALLQSLAKFYGVVLVLTRDSSDTQLFPNFARLETTHRRSESSLSQVIGFAICVWRRVSLFLHHTFLESCFPRRLFSCVSRCLFGLCVECSSGVAHQLGA